MFSARASAGEGEVIDEEAIIRELQEQYERKKHVIYNSFENLPMHYTVFVFFSAVKIENFIGKILILYNIFAQNIDCGYSLEPPCRVPTIYVLD